MQITFTTSEIKEDIIGQEIIKRIAAQFMSVTSNDELKIDSKIDELKNKLSICKTKYYRP